MMFASSQGSKGVSGGKLKVASVIVYNKHFNIGRIFEGTVIVMILPVFPFVL